MLQTSQKFISADQQILDILKKVDQDTFPKLEHVGKIFYLDHPNAASKKYWIFGAVKRYFSKQILLRGGLVDHHKSESYKEAFDNIDLGEHPK